MCLAEVAWDHPPELSKFESPAVSVTMATHTFDSSYFATQIIPPVMLHIDPNSKLAGPAESLRSPFQSNCLRPARPSSRAMV